MNFGSLMNEILYGSKLYIMCVWRLLHMLVVIDVAMCATLGL